ncbi:MAG TPA: hypothetical protein VGL53_07285 [Bryobacteraceae bacterium]|jgi:hypothetical protein
MTIAEQFFADSSSTGKAHSPYRLGMQSLIDDLEKIVKVLNDSGAPYEFIDGVAVNTHIFAGHRSRSFVTRDIDVMIGREDLATVIEASRLAGYDGRRIMGGFMLIRPGQEPGEAVHLVVSGERSKSTQPLPHPPVQPEWKDMAGLVIPVAPLADLVRMKLTSFRPKDLVHLEILESTGLITLAIESALPPELLNRLASARQQFAENEPDVE